MFYSDPRLGMHQGNLHKADDEDGSWITMNGTHVHMKDGEVDKGPQKVKDHVHNSATREKNPQEAKEQAAKQLAEKIDSARKDGSYEALREAYMDWDKNYFNLPSNDPNRNTGRFVPEKLPTIQGSEKQVAWAADLKSAALSELVRNPIAGTNPRQASAIFDRVKSETSSRVFIDNRGDGARGIVGGIFRSDSAFAQRLTAIK